jgi:hypothetical protein
MLKSLVQQVKEYPCRTILQENELLKTENNILKSKLAEKQEHINKTNNYWKKKMREVKEMRDMKHRVN